MNICIVTTIYPPDIGGPATYSRELAIRLSKESHNIHIVTWGSEYKKNDEGYLVHTIKRNNLPKPFNLFLNLFRMCKLTRYVVKKYNIDIIYAQNSDTAGLPALYASKKTKKPLAIKFVGDWAWETSILKNKTKKGLDEFYLNPDKSNFIRFLKLFERKIGNNATVFIVPSNYLKKILSLWPISKKVYVIPNVLDVPRVKTKKIKHPSFVSVGRLVPWKNFDSVIRAIVKLKKTHFYLIGEGPSKGYLKELVLKLRINDRIHFLGKLPRKEALSYIKSSDYCILPSYYEGMSHTLLEAMALKIPVIANNIQSNEELLRSGKFGELIDFNDKNLPSILKKIVKKPSRKKVNMAYIHTKKNHSWNLHTNKLIEIFHKILESK